MAWYVSSLINSSAYYFFFYYLWNTFAYFFMEKKQRKNVIEFCYLIWLVALEEGKYYRFLDDARCSTSPVSLSFLCLQLRLPDPPTADSFCVTIQGHAVTVSRVWSRWIEDWEKEANSSFKNDLIIHPEVYTHSVFIYYNSIYSWGLHN